MASGPSPTQVLPLAERYVREAGSLTLMDAIRKSSLMPARRLEAIAPQMKNKGRLRAGATVAQKKAAAE